MNGNKKLFP